MPVVRIPIRRSMPLAAAAAGLAAALLGTGLGAMTRPTVKAVGCIAQPEEGNWQNADPNTRSLTRIDLRFVCQDQMLNGEPYPPGPTWHIRVLGKCHPSDCDWGDAGAERLGSGQVFGRYAQGYAERFVYVGMSQVKPGQLWVYTHTDFADPARPDYGVHNWFTKP